MKRFCMGLLAVVLLGGAALVLADAAGLHLSLFTVAGGGGTVSGGGYTLTGSIGQADAGVLQGGGYTLYGGYPAIVATDTATATSTASATGTNVPPTSTATGVPPTSTKTAVAVNNGHTLFLPRVTR